MDLSKLRWRKSTYSGDNGGNCVEVAELTNTPESIPTDDNNNNTLIAVRDSKDPDGPKLFFTTAEWDAFLNGVKANEFG
jgi:hypothetical protein